MQKNIEFLKFYSCGVSYLATTLISSFIIIVNFAKVPSVIGDGIQIHNFSIKHLYVNKKLRNKIAFNLFMYMTSFINCFQ